MKDVEGKTQIYYRNKSPCNIAESFKSFHLGIHRRPPSLVTSGGSGERDQLTAQTLGYKT